MYEKEILWDRLAGTIVEYVENYFLQKEVGDRSGKFHIGPSYDVDYEISDEILRAIDESMCTGKIENYWVFQIDSCRDINELSKPLQQLVIQYLPKFYKMFPEYKDAECLMLKNT